MKIKLANVRLSFPNLWEPREFKAGDGKFRYDATFLVEPGSQNDKLINEAIDSVLAEAFPKEEQRKKVRAAWEGNSQKWAYLDGDLKDYDGYEGMKYLACHRRAADGPPTILDADGTPLSETDGRPYGGCFVHAIAEVYAMTKGNPGLFASFSGVRYFKKGEAFGGGTPASADDFAEFDDLADGAEESDDDDISAVL